MSASPDPRADVVLAGRILADHGHEDFVWGHVSLRDPAGAGVWMKGSGLGLGEVTIEDVVLVGWDGEVLDGTRPRHREYPIHTELMHRHPAVQSVVHTHPRHAVALGLTDLDVQPLSQAAGLFLDGVPRFTETARLIDSPSLGAAVADVFDGPGVALLANHGIAAAGRSLPHAVLLAITLERACAEQLLAAAAGGAVPRLDPAAARDAFGHIDTDAYIDASWGFLVREAGRDRRSS
jgi:L-ribulose-5-phosphate 4-epimerase